MRLARALILSPVVPLLAVAVAGIGAGYTSVAGLARFLLVWAAIIYPLVLVFALGGYFAARWFRCNEAWHFALGGFAVGSLLGFAWFYPMHVVEGASSLLPTAAFVGAAGTIGVLTGLAFWLLIGGRRAV